MTPAVFLTALSEVDDRVEGLRAGGDDYMAKPFTFSELLARLEAVTSKRVEAEVDPRVEQHGKVVHRGQQERLRGRGEDGPVLPAKGNDNGFLGVRDGKLEGEVAVDLADRGLEGKAELGAQGREHLCLGREIQPHQERADAAAPLFLEIKGLLDPFGGKS
jgi:hypothetical protein